MNFEEIKKLDEEYVIKTYGRYPLALDHGSGCYVWDSEGKKYLDMLAGIAVNVLGHAHEQYAKALYDQAKKLVHVSNLYYTENQAVLAKKIDSLAPISSKTFFCNSGAEANEAAIKIARKFTGKREIIAMSNSFHGRTMGSLAITDKKRYQAPFEPLMPETRIVGYGDIESIRSAVNDNTAAIFTELIQGEGGIKFPAGSFEESKEYFAELRELCDEKDILMIIDEVQTGSGRTGTYFAAEQFDLKPDVLTSAKGVAGGFPMGVTICKKEIANCMEAGDHASTFGGNPLGCAAGIATINTILDESLMDNAKEVGNYCKEELSEYNIRGLGLMLGLELESEEKAKEVMLKMREAGVLVNVTGEKVIRMVPPLIISKEEMGQAVEKLKGLI